jgi:hypothetical protein
MATKVTMLRIFVHRCFVIDRVYLFVAVNDWSKFYSVAYTWVLFKNEIWFDLYCLRNFSEVLNMKRLEHLFLSRFLIYFDEVLYRLFVHKISKQSPFHSQNNDISCKKSLFTQTGQRMTLVIRFQFNISYNILTYNGVYF